MLIGQAEDNLRELGVTLVESLIEYPKYLGLIGYEVSIRSAMFKTVIMRSRKRQRNFENAIKKAIKLVKHHAEISRKNTL